MVRRLALALLALAGCSLGAYLGAWWVPFPAPPAALAGLPPYAAVTVAATLLLAVLQVLAGAWLARAAAPRRVAAAEPAGAPDPGDPER